MGEWNKEKAGFCPSSDLHQLKSNNCYQNLSCGEPCISQVFLAIRNFCFLFPWNSTLNKPRTLFLFGLSYMLVVSVLLYNATYFICHWKGLTYLWSISFWMSLFSSSTFCWSFFLLCSGGRLLKSSGPAPCTAWDGGGEERKKKKKRETKLRAWKNLSWLRFENSSQKSVQNHNGLKHCYCLYWELSVPEWSQICMP